MRGFLWVALMLVLTVSGAQAAEVNLYSARQENLIKPLLDRFTEETGIRVNLVAGRSDALIQRLRTEGEHSPADVILAVDAAMLQRAYDAGVTQSFQSPVLAAAVPAAYRHPRGHWYGLSLRARPIIYSKARVQPEQLSGYETLAEPEWRSRVCMRSSSNVYNQSLVASMVAALGAEQVEQWARGLVANFARPPAGGDRDQIKAIAAGQCDVTVANTYYLVKMLTADDAEQVAAGQQVAVFWPEQTGRGAHVNVTGAALLRSSKNRAEAIKLIEFMGGEEAQRWYADTNGEYPVRAGVSLHPLLQAWGGYRADQLNLSELGRLNAEAVRVMDRAGWR